MTKVLKKAGAGEVLSLTWPIFIELLLQMLVGNADQIMVGWFDPDGVSAIGNANQVTNLVLLLFSVVSVASTILIARALGSGDVASVRRIYHGALVCNAACGVLVSGVLLLAGGVIFRMMGVPAEIFSRAQAYLRVIGYGMLFQSIYVTFSAFFRSHQMMKQTLAVSAVVNLMNIGGNAVFIPRMGVTGAALASDLSRLVGVVVIFWLFRRKFGPVLSLSGLKPFPRQEVSHLLSIGIPSGGESVSYNLSQICIQTVCNRFALYVINTRVYASLFANCTYMLGAAVSQAAQVLAARYYGARDGAMTRRVVQLSLVISLVTAGAVSTLLYLLHQPLYRLFTQDTHILAICGVIMLLEIPLELGRAVNMTICRALQACGDIAFPIGCSILGAWLVAVGGSWLFGVGFGWGLPGLWAAMAADECLRAIMLLLRWRKIQKKLPA